MEKVYLIDIDEQGEETYMIANSLVEYPAHQKSFYQFEKKPVMEYFFEEEKRMITGVVIDVNKPIYRNDKQIGEHYVVFTKQAAHRILLNMKKNNILNVVDLNHSGETVSGLFEFETWIVDRANNKGVPKALEKQNIEDGSIMATYKIESEKIWADIKEGKFNGFSIEGVFYKVPIKIKKIEMQSDKIKKIAMELKKIKAINL